jgi:hypothetical protein
MHKVGGEVDAFCSRCDMVLAHTIHAMLSGRPVKVECNTCHAVHRFRDPPGKAPARSGTARSAKPGAGPRERTKAEVTGFDELLAARDVAAAQPYSPKKRFAVGEVVDHAVFGRGFISAVRDGDKVEITFRSDVKVLVHGRT